MRTREMPLLEEDSLSAGFPEISYMSIYISLARTYSYDHKLSRSPVRNLFLKLRRKAGGP